MANISDVSSDMTLVKQSYLDFVALGEGVTGNEFTMTVDGYPDLQYLIQTTQLPAMQREDVEGYGPHGVEFHQQGKYKNYQEVPFSVKEVVSGAALAALRAWVKQKQYLTVTLKLTPDSQPDGNTNTTCVMEDVWITLDGTDLSVEDGATLVKPAGTFHANWIGWLDEDTGA